MPPQTHPGSTKEKLTNITELNRKWLREKDKTKRIVKTYT
jgi:hypothetical protein